MREEHQSKANHVVEMHSNNTTLEKYCKCTSCHALPTSPPPTASAPARDVYRPFATASRVRDVPTSSASLPRESSVDKLAPRVPVRADTTRLCSTSSFEQTAHASSRSPKIFQPQTLRRSSNTERTSSRDVIDVHASHTLPHVRGGILKNSLNQTLRGNCNTGSSRTQNRVRLALPHCDDDIYASSSDTSGSHVTSESTCSATRTFRKHSLV